MNRRARFLAKAGPWLLAFGILGAAGSRVDFWLILSMWGGAVIAGIFAGFAFRKGRAVWFFATLVGWVGIALISCRLLASEIAWVSPSEWIAYWFGGIGVLGIVLRLMVRQVVGHKRDG